MVSVVILTRLHDATGEAIKIPAKLAPAFSFGQPFKDQVAGKEKAPKKVAAPKAPKVPKAPKPVAVAKPKAKPLPKK